MFKRAISILLLLVLVAANLTVGISPTLGDEPPKGYHGRVTPAERQAAAVRAAAARAAAKPSTRAPTPTPQPGGTPDYFGIYSNYANSPLPELDALGNVIPGTGIRKFVDSLPGLGATAANNLGQYIPIANPDTITYPGSDYYVIALREYSEKLHSDLPPTKLRGYVQINNGTNTGTNLNTITPEPIHYLGPLIIAQRDKPVRILFVNQLPTGSGGDLFIPVDKTIMGAGTGPNGGTETYTENRATLHLHGGLTPWISDGTPHQWITPAGENTSYPKGVSVSNVPDMPDPGPGAQTFFYSNQQSARLMFYHDHAYGITRLNVYSGEAAGYLLTDPVENALVNGGTIQGRTYIAGTIPATQIPLVIQDKSFVPDNTRPYTNLVGTFPSQLNAQDPTWDSAKYGGYGQLWFPHVYVPNQNPYDASGANAMGRWDYGPWFWPPYTGLQYGPVANPYYTAGGTEPPLIPGVPNPSLTPESFMDTPLVNGTAYPYITLDPKTYRLRILNACNDRFLNLQLYVADPTITTGAGVGKEVKMVPAIPNSGLPASWPTDARPGGVPDPALVGPDMIQIGTEGGFLPAPVVIPAQPISYNYNRRDIVVLNVADHALFLGPAERADIIIDLSQYAGKTLILYNDSPAPVPAFDPRYDYYTGDPNQTDTGGAPTTLAGYGPNTRTILQIRVTNTAPAPAFNLTRLQTAFASDATTPGAFAASQDPIVIPQDVYNSAYNATYPSQNLVKIQDNFLTAPSSPQTVSTVTVLSGGTGYTSTPSILISGGGGSNATATAIVSGGVVTGIIVNNHGSGFTSAPVVSIFGGGGTGASAIPNLTNTITFPLQSKAIQELFTVDYGRMNATLGVELPFTNFQIQTTIPLGYIDPYTESINDSITPMSPVAGDGTQIWKITHNGVDTHVIHFHLFNVQIINRVGWDGAIRPPDPNELGWKDTVKMNPLEDCIVALRPVAPKMPFGVPDSVRPMDVTMPLGTTGQFGGVDPLTNNPITVVNQLVNFGWEYVWHCHILGHEENDMMRPISFNVTEATPAVPILAATGTGGNVTLTWLDGTPFNYTTGLPISTLGNPANEIGFRVLRATVTNGTPGPYAQVGTAPANVTSFVDGTAVGGRVYRYYVVAYNAAGSANSNTADVTPPTTNVLIGTGDVPMGGIDGADNLIMDKYVAQANGNVTQIRVKAGAAGDVKVAIYADSAGQPGGLLSASNIGTPVVPGWNTIPIASTPVTQGTTYWLAFNTDVPSILFTGSGGTGLYKPGTLYGGFSFSNPAGTGFYSWQGYHTIAGWGVVVSATAPTVTNGSGATNTYTTTARLNGNLSGGAADITVYWGTTDGGTTAASWTNSMAIGTKSVGPFFADINGLIQGTTYYYRCFAQNPGGSAWAATSLTFSNRQGPNADYDGDGKTDIGVFRPSDNSWWIRQSGNGQLLRQSWGLSGDIPILGDYDRDGKADIGVFRPLENSWWISETGISQLLWFSWGVSGDIRVPRDYDGDGKTDVAVYRPSTGQWWIYQSGVNQLAIKSWGLAGDIPVPGDYDKDGKTDLAVFRPSTGQWWIGQSSNNQTVVQSWGISGDIPVQGDYDGDGKTDIAVYRPSNGSWWIRQSVNGQLLQVQWGITGDTPVPGDYDGDGKVDVAVYRPSGNTWWVKQSSDSQLLLVSWGTTGDIPLP